MSASETKSVTALILDLDGVVTDTATQHFQAWKRMFDEYLGPEGRDGGEAGPFTRDDYLRYVDGKPRIEGVESFLASRGIELERGSPEDPEGPDSLWGLGNRKNRYYHEILDREGVEPFPDALALLRSARERGCPVAIVSSSRNAGRVMDAAGVTRLVDTSVDGRDIAELNLEGKPAPDLFLEAARRLGVAPGDAAIFEDARAGVRAGRRGGFGLVVGVARSGEDDELLEAGADVTVPRIDELDLFQR